MSRPDERAPWESEGEREHEPSVDDERVFPRASARRKRILRAQQRGVALIMVLGAITILTVILAEFQEEAGTEATAAIADRDALKAEFAARSAIQLARLLIASEPTIRTAIGPLLSLMMGGSGAPQIPVWEYADQVLGAFNDSDGAAAFNSLAGVDATKGKNLGMKGQSFEVTIIDEDSKLNLNTASRGDAITQQRLGLSLIGLMTGDQYNPMFENRAADGQYADRATVCGAIVDWADGDENFYGCDPRNAQNTGSASEDQAYSLLKVPYRRKNAPYDSLEELHLVRGVSDDFFATFVDPDPTNPRKRVMTVWGQGSVNVNSANAQTLLAVVCGAAVQNPPQLLCSDITVQAKFLTAVNLLRGFTAGAPLFSTPKAFVKAIQGQGMFGKILKEMVGLEPVQLISAAELEKQVSTESKVFSIYADGIVTGYKRTTKVRVHAVVDFRSAPAPQAAPLSASAAAALGIAAPTATATSSSQSAAAAATQAIAAALQPSSGGQVIYFRIE
jgi:general secretion pathway protein K